MNNCYYGEECIRHLIMCYEQETLLQTHCKTIGRRQWFAISVSSTVQWQFDNCATDNYV